MDFNKKLYIWLGLVGINKSKEKLKYLENIKKILEDCAPSLGATFERHKSWSCENSDCSILSFHPVKRITTGGLGRYLKL